MKQFTRFLALGAAVLATTALWSAPGQACSRYTTVGTMCITAADFCPRGFLPANGESITENSHPELWTVLGRAFGATQTERALPDLGARAPVGVGNIEGQLKMERGLMRGKRKEIFFVPKKETIQARVPTTQSLVLLYCIKATGQTSIAADVENIKQ